MDSVNRAFKEVCEQNEKKTENNGNSKCSKVDSGEYDKLEKAI